MDKCNGVFFDSSLSDFVGVILPLYITEQALTNRAYEVVYKGKSTRRSITQVKISCSRGLVKEGTTMRLAHFMSRI